MKIIGVMMILLSSTLCGLTKALQLSEKTRQLQQIELMLNELATQIRFCRKNLLQIFDDMRAQKQYDGLAFLHDLKISECELFESIWHEAIYGDFKLTDSEKSALLPLGLSLGSTDVEGQLSALEMASERISVMLCDAREKFPAKMRLYMSMGVLCGAMLAVLMI